jgi:Flp pilus assembly protein TadG
MLFTVDMGRLVLLTTGLHDAAAVSARAGARQGQAGTEKNGPSFRAFEEASKVVPGLQDSQFKIVSPTTSVGSAGSKWCTTDDQYVRITATSDISFITPGLGALLGLVGSVDPSDAGVTISATGVARCEVIR